MATIGDIRNIKIINSSHPRRCVCVCDDVMIRIYIIFVYTQLTNEVAHETTYCTRGYDFDE